MLDEFGRTIDYLRISVTDRCNLRCIYCMPEEGVETLSHFDILSYEETLRLARIFSELGITTIRLTGGEPLVRRGIESLAKEIHDLPGITEVGITTNAIALPDKFEGILASGINNINISLDTLNPVKFEKITRRPGLEKVLEAIDLCVENGINTKINCVAMKGVNDDDFLDLVSLAKDKPISVRFIEYMPVGKNDFEKMVPSDEIIKMIEDKYGKMFLDHETHGKGPATYYKIEGFKGTVGFISAMSHCFCDSCNRLRLTAEGYLKLCLQYDIGIDLRKLMREGKSDEEIKNAILDAVQKKPKQHTFNNYDDAENIEEKGMSKIGG